MNYEYSSVSTAFMIASILFLDIANLVKVASTMKLMLFAFANLSVILMRESRIFSYRPTFKSPLYPYLQIIGTTIYFFLIIEMGKTPLLITLAFFAISIIWFLIYSKSRNEKKSALLHIVERIMPNKIKTPTLGEELRTILIERDEIIEDRFDEIIKESEILDIDDELNMNELFGILSKTFSKRLNINEQTILSLLKEREADTTTVINSELAIPHIIIDGVNSFDIVALRCKKGIKKDSESPRFHIVFALAGTKDERNFHLRALMAIAQITHKRKFSDNWLKAKNADQLKNLILVTHRRRHSYPD